MARLVIITHEYDRFTSRPLRWPALRSDYLLFDVLRLLERHGHSWRVSTGPRAVSGDVAFLHVDTTLVAPEYLALAPQFAGTINFATADISKRTVSRVRVMQGDDWAGPVIVKSNLNANGQVEQLHNRRARAAGRPLPHPVVHHPPYRVLRSVREVGSDVWDDPYLIVERFLPEVDADGFALRTWVFMGDREGCTRQVAPDPIVKAGIVIRYEKVAVPEQLRAERERLGFEFGKFDFVVHDGEPVLLDTNRTPGTARSIRTLMKERAPLLAEGLDGLIRAKT